MRESTVLGAVLKLGRGAQRLFRNQVGFYELADGRRLRSGLCNGSSDVIGWRTVEVTPDMVGRRLAVFVAIECKAPGERPEAPQASFLRQVTEGGGLAGVAWSAADAEAILSRTPGA